MLDRYTSKEFKHLWSEQKKYKTQLQVEFEALAALEHCGIVPAGVSARIQESYHFFRPINVERIHEIEEQTRHETAAFVAYLEEVYGEDAKWFHYGLTSSDVLDTAQALLMSAAMQLLIDKIIRVEDTLISMSKKYADVPMIGRSHGMHAEPTTFGFILSGHASEMARNTRRMYQAKSEISCGKLSGPVGNFTYFPQEAEVIALRKLKLYPEPASTQVVARDRYAQYFSTLALAATSIERLVTTIRHCQRTEVGELAEGFGSKQQGSSAMPHKKNPILSENLTGLARMVRSTVMPAMENVGLWHERDMSHSSVERHICPEATSTLGYMLDRLQEILQNLVVKPERMLENINSSYGVWASQGILLTLIRQGFSRSKAYEVVQRNSFECLKKKIPFKEQLLTDPEITDTLSVAELRDCCSLDPIISRNKEFIDNLFGKYR